ncbi:NADH-quinone oxidoreductase subunit L [Rhodophyticola sp. CCM32]|uniref:NADH-quinone oxidoreductase subunit L n=1 Tax=Rhodophyticola sp. CCM32 TaxID=2916397 RepID=UPI00107F45D7|nr:NADH-quinone oxidoreductase subunit L [Rhodophyticola sp. CCM32]QBY00162.1 NADH-quinone oxidoreductase subunit L [Rhodophyticola sp. CCM32]
METILLFAPLVGALICGFSWRLIGEQGACITATVFLFASCLLSWIVFLGFDGETVIHPLFAWIESGSLAVDWAIRIDRLTAIMLIVITTVSALVHLYSFGYMAHDDHFKEGESYRPRFFAYLSFFTFTMLMLVTADNLLQLFFGWEGVGVASYLLIGFYYRKPSAGAAAMKAFIVNRVGDFGFLLGIFALFWMADSISFDVILSKGPELAETTFGFLGYEVNAANTIGMLLFIGAMGKSAQLFLHTWLPDAMEGPTPVSALIHAATMVTAGVFLVCRMSPILEYAPFATNFIIILGAATAFFAATIGLVQNDIKRVIAYSTCSQLGYMFVAAGVGVYSVAMFHLLTHAFFKAMLFLGAGSVIHAMHHEQDMRNYGGLRKKIPYTFAAMLVGTLAITGVGIPLTHIGFAGFFSKDAVIESAFAFGDGLGAYAFWMLVIAAAFTSFYSWRLIFMTFFGTARGDKHTHDHAHESPWTMLAPLGVLALGATFSGFVWYNSFFGHTDHVAEFFGVSYAEAGHHGEEDAHGAAQDSHGAEDSHADASSEAPHDGEADAHAAEAAHGEDSGHGEEGEHHYVFTGAPGEGAIHMAPDNTVMNMAHEVPKWVKLSPFIAMIAGLVVAIQFYLVAPGLPGRWAEVMRPLYLFLLNKWYFDEIYDAVFVRPARWLGRFLWKRGDGDVIDGGINGLAMGIIPFFTRLAGRAQSGYIFHYAFAMVLGIVILITWASLSVGG